MFILRTLMEKFKKSKKTLFMCFIDFKKAFDTVWHSGLLFKLIQSGVSSKFYGVIKSMYKHAQLTVQCGQRLTPSFTSKTGVRQGDNLSPTLFNLFISDIPSLFTDCNAPVIGNIRLPCLLYADDLIIFSESREGMQKALDKLENYCNIWGLKVNIAKSKLMCLNKQSLDGAVQFGLASIERVNSYTYLGVEFNDQCNFEYAKKELYKKGLKVYFKLVRSLSPTPKASTMLHLFDHLIKPVLLYGCEIWGPFSLNFKEPKPSEDPRVSFFQSLKINYPLASRRTEAKDPIEKIHIKLCKYILGVGNNTASMGVYGDLGRSPLYIDQVICCLKYYYHLVYSEDNKLLKMVFDNLKSKEIPTYNVGLGGFAEKVHKLYGLSLAPTIKSSAGVINRLRGILRANFLSFWMDSVQTNYSKSSQIGNNKLRSYKIFKVQFKKEKYLDLPEYSLRNALARFRLSSHRLRIESGRYTGGKYLPPNERICPNCSLGEVEDERHFLLECPVYNAERDILFQHISQSNPYFAQYNDLQKFTWLMSNDNIADVKQVALYLHTALHWETFLRQWYFSL